VVKCSDCGSENREGAKFCDGCGAKLGLAIAEPEPVAAAEVSEEQGLPASPSEDEGAADAGTSEVADVSEVTEPEAEPELTEPEAEAEAEASSEFAEPDEDVPEEGPGDLAEEVSEEVPEAVEEEVPQGPPKTGYLVFPDNTYQPIPPSQWLIGRADLAKFLPDQKKANEISRGHLTVFQEGDKFFVEDGATMVQRKPSANKTWLVRKGSRILVTGTGRTELQDADEIDVAELVKLHFVMK
jgi:zinc-ribbon domain